MRTADVMIWGWKDCLLLNTRRDLGAVRSLASLHSIPRENEPPFCLRLLEQGIHCACEKLRQELPSQPS